MNFDEILRFAVKHDASDVHVQALSPPMMRIAGKIRSVESPSAATWATGQTLRVRGRISQPFLTSQKHLPYMDGDSVENPYIILTYRVEKPRSGSVT